MVSHRMGLQDLLKKWFLVAIIYFFVVFAQLFLLCVCPVIVLLSIVVPSP